MGGFPKTRPLSSVCGRQCCGVSCRCACSKIFCIWHAQRICCVSGALTRACGPWGNDIRLYMGRVRVFCARAHGVAGRYSPGDRDHGVIGIFGTIRTIHGRGGSELWTVLSRCITGDGQGLRVSGVCIVRGAEPLYQFWGAQPTPHF